MKKKTLKRIDLLLLAIVILLITFLVYRISNKEKLSDAYLASDTSNVLVYDEDDKEVSLVRGQLVSLSDKTKEMNGNEYHKVYLGDTVYYVYKDNIVSKCPCFITKDTELITCHQIMNNIKIPNNETYYEEYIKILEEKGIKDARIKLENMYILDFLIMNEDRHLNNFGIIRDVNTLKWLDIAPIFDNGQSLNIEYYDEEEMHIRGEGKLFYEIKSFDEIIKVVKNIKRININKLENLPEWFDNLLHKYQNLSGYSDTKINKLCILLNRQINKLKKIIESS